MSLKERLIRQIRMDGPMPVSAFMQICLHDPKNGYYARGAGLGRDFITAPDTSQIFGELIGLWIVNEWRALGAPARFNLVEMGGGRGTLMSDALRAAEAFLPSNCITLIMIEASPVLRAQQADHLQNWSPKFLEALHDLPKGPMILIANELLDCLPARQFVKEDNVWRERIIGLNEAGKLSFGIDRSDLPSNRAYTHDIKPIRAEAELQPALDTIADQLHMRADTDQPLRALFIDYGPTDTTPADTLRAYKQGKQVDPLACPGEADLTVDVDFSRLSKVATRRGLQVSGPVTQGAFLGALGLQDRLDCLIKANPAEAQALFDGAQKLVDPAHMGTRFKVICLSSYGLPDPAGFLP